MTGAKDQAECSGQEKQFPSEYKVFSPVPCILKSAFKDVTRTGPPLNYPSSLHLERKGAACTREILLFDDAFKLLRSNV